MKHIIIEGGDRLGKDTLIKNLCEYFNYDNISIRHFGKAPTGLSPEDTLNYQFIAFESEAELIQEFKMFPVIYFKNVVIWNRSHLGEYVYAQMFRKIKSDVVMARLLKFEAKHILPFVNSYLITLTADPEFFLNQEDGKSFSKNIQEKTEELKLFKEVHEMSLITNKKIIKVNKGENFRDEKEIFADVLQLITK